MQRALRCDAAYSIRAQIAAKVAQELNALKNASADGSTTFDAVSRSVPHLCTGTALAAGCPHLRRDWAHPCHICTGTAPTRVLPAQTRTGPTERRARALQRADRSGCAARVL